MKRLFALLLTCLLVLSLAACGETAPEQTEPETTQAAETTEATEETTAAADRVVLPEGSPDYFQLSISDEYGNYKALTAYNDGMGQAAVDYQGEVRKVTTMELTVLDELAEVILESGLPALDGENIFEDGVASASMYVTYTDGGYLGAGYNGTISQQFLDGYDFMDDWFQKLLADVPEYVARPVVSGEVNADVLTELETILDASGMEPLDMFTISDVPKDEFFCGTMGLTTDAGIANGTACNPMMSVTAYSCVVATLEDESKLSDVQKDFAANIDWNRWVCVSADSALIAQKGNMVLCLVASGEMYQQTATAIEANGWTTLETLKKNG